MGVKFKLGPWGREVLPSHLRDRKHDDWPFFLKWAPRWANAFGGEGPDYPEGVPHHSLPRDGEHTYWLYDKKGWWRPYYALSFAIGSNIWHFRVGFRWDDVDHYYNLVVPWMATIKVIGKV